MLVKKIMGSGGLVGGGTPPSGDDYWVVEVSDVRRLGYVLVNSSNDVIAAFEDAQAVAVVSLDKDGVENWQKKYVYSTYDSVGFKRIAVDSSDNIYISTNYDLGLGAVRDIALLKTSASTQAVLAQVGISSSAFDTPGEVSVDSSDNIYQALYYNDGTVATAGLAKYDSSLSLDWIYKFNDGTNASLFTATAIDSSGYIYAGGHARGAGTYEERPYLVKLNSSGTIQWSINTTNTISTVQDVYDYGGVIRDILIDSSDNIYISISSTYSVSENVRRLHILKLNSSGTVQWHKQFSSTASAPASPAGDTFSMCITTGGVLVACWRDGTESPGTTAVVGLDPSDGSVSWQRTINKKTYNSIYAHPLGGWCFSVADSSSPYGGYIARLPDDGSLTGYWNSFIYDTSSRWVLSTGGMTWGAPSISAVSDSPTETTPSYSDTASSYTLTKATDAVTSILKGFVTKAVTTGSDWNSGNVLDVLSVAEEGDLVLIAFSADNSTTSWSWEGMSFTDIENVTSSSNPGTYVGYRIVQAGDSNPYLGGSSSLFGHLTVIAAIFSPVFTTFENSNVSNGSGTNLNPPAVTATASLWIITGHLDDDPNATFTMPSGYTLIGAAGDPSVTSSTCIGYKEESLTSEDPGVIIPSAYDAWRATTVAFS